MVGVDFAEPRDGAGNWDLWMCFGSGDCAGDFVGIVESELAWIWDVDFGAGDLVCDCGRDDVASGSEFDASSVGNEKPVRLKTVMLCGAEFLYTLAGRTAGGTLL